MREGGCVTGMNMETEARVAVLAQRLLDKVEQAIGELDLQVTTHRVKTKKDSGEETTEFYETRETGLVDRAGLKQLTAVLKELQTITGAGVQDAAEEETGVIVIPCRKEAEGNR